MKKIRHQIQTLTQSQSTHQTPTLSWTVEGSLCQGEAGAEEVHCPSYLLGWRETRAQDPWSERPGEQNRLDKNGKAKYDTE